ncbi:MAG: hypothetical protein ACRD0Z_16555 [Acidimicrobiales bacterium]
MKTDVIALLAATGGVDPVRHPERAVAGWERRRDRHLRGGGC